MIESDNDIARKPASVILTFHETEKKVSDMLNANICIIGRLTRDDEHVRKHNAQHDNSHSKNLASGTRP